MEYVELAAGIFLLSASMFVDANNTRSIVLLKMPMPVFGALIAADALSRLGLI